jgi:hypothetical protein
MAIPDLTAEEPPENLDSLIRTQIKELAHSWPKIAPGIYGEVVIRATQKTMFINIIASGQPGRGLVGKYLDNLPADFTIIVPSVLSQRFAGMLARRGFMSGPAEGSWTRKPAA